MVVAFGRPYDDSGTQDRRASYHVLRDYRSTIEIEVDSRHGNCSSLARYITRVVRGRRARRKPRERERERESRESRATQDLD